MCICLQHIGPKAVLLRNYQLACYSTNGNGELGTAIYVNNHVKYEILIPPVNIYQPTIIRLFLPDGNKITICNIYNQPDFNSNFNDLAQLVDNLPQPLLILGDFNAHNPLWDYLHSADPAGINIENFIC